MKVTIRTVFGKYLSAQPDGSFQLREEPSLASDSWEVFDLNVLSDGIVLTAPTNNEPSNIATMDFNEISSRVHYWLKRANSNDSPKYWIKTILDNKGWVTDAYWSEFIMRGDGVGKGYDPNAV